jgi:hypothetical protein
MRDPPTEVGNYLPKYGLGYENQGAVNSPTNCQPRQQWSHQVQLYSNTHAMLRLKSANLRICDLWDLFAFRPSLAMLLVHCAVEHHLWKPTLLIKIKHCVQVGKNLSVNYFFLLPEISCRFF